MSGQCTFTLHRDHKVKGWLLKSLYCRHDCHFYKRKTHVASWVKIIIAEGFSFKLKPTVNIYISFLVDILDFARQSSLHLTLGFYSSFYTLQMHL